MILIREVARKITFTLSSATTIYKLVKVLNNIWQKCQ